MLSLKQLRYFDAVARNRHIGRAAERCAVTQPAFSMQNQDGVAGHIPVGAPCCSVGVVARAACLARNGKGQGARCAANAASQTMTLKIWALRIPGNTAAIVIIAIVSASLMPHLAAVFGLSSQPPFIELRSHCPSGLIVLRIVLDKKN
jgi:hypothetical protein